MAEDCDNENQASNYAGSLKDRYDVYAEQARQLGWTVKTFDEWLNS